MTSEAVVLNKLSLEGERQTPDKLSHMWSTKKNKQGNRQWPVKTNPQLTEWDLSGIRAGIGE